MHSLNFSVRIFFAIYKAELKVDMTILMAMSLFYQEITENQ